ncbi:MAG: tryptophan synthase subunit alpha [Propionibacteriaceae bacterium]|nr:tryptophan synthase subunit alpha [Propionibacteriaceae bacterium]
MNADLGITGRVLRAARAQGRAGLVAYLPLGYPSVSDSYTAMAIAAQAADLVEIGLPYSDPVMDGATIQRATQRALERGVRVRDVFGACEAVAAEGKHGLVMTYWNLVERYGVDAFARDLAAAGGAGLITPDLPPDEAAEWIEASDAHGLDRVFLVAPGSTDQRIGAAVAACRGWVYATSVMGVTGARSQTSQDAPLIVARARAAGDLPVGVGLGVSTGDQAAAVAAYADAVIVGSALVESLDGSGCRDYDRLTDRLEELAKGVRRAH